MSEPDPRNEDYIDRGNPHTYEIRDEMEENRRDGTSGWYPTDADQGTTIWRYMDLGKFASLIQSSQLWFSHRSLFDDPYEGRYSKEVAEEIQHEKWNVEEPNDEDSAYFIDNNLDEYVSCWNMKENQSAALWKMYVEGDNGVAIKSTVGQLREAINWFSDTEFNRSIEFGKVEYHVTGEEPRGRYAPIFTKRDLFDFEQEYRIVLTSYEPLEDVEIEGVKIRDQIGVGVEIDLNHLIDDVYISPAAGGYLQDVVKRLRDDYGPNYSIKKSTAYDHPLVES